jgi:hypothetical protein
MHWNYSKSGARMYVLPQERIIESAGEVAVGASAVVSAVTAYAKINANGQWVERTEQVS